MIDPTLKPAGARGGNTGPRINTLGGGSGGGGGGGGGSGGGVAAAVAGEATVEHHRMCAVWEDVLGERPKPRRWGAAEGGKRVKEPILPDTLRHSLYGE
eukprot:CAMPEP_0206302652 /NCGR_PEP_ID=MMETSP0106_2-20121207/8833_1 /ASSEMBLY_ACC=CAM_ASM_000206 /TAXON_ID=81532 /ORGANISM="Acanthoeca-like sp., Strain 10tr" /LENGTH=98 /DNA_ID=CAMNT_0053733425 /DNA_START=81 /DNA_END=377 /DNA_ORIENTATION=+